MFSNVRVSTIRILIPFLFHINLSPTFIVCMIRLSDFKRSHYTMPPNPSNLNNNRQRSIGAEMMRS